MSKPQRHALHVAASFFDHHIEDTFVHREDGAVVIGGEGVMALPAPSGQRYLARVEWTRPDQVTVTSGAGQTHLLDVDEKLILDEGPVRLELRLAPQFRHRRAEALSFFTSLVWFTVVLAATITTSQWEDVWELRCLWHPAVFGYQHPDCLPPENSGQGNSGYSVAYLDRLLDKDYSGADDGGGVTGGGEDERDQQVERPSYDKTSDAYIPAGNEGPRSRDGGAAEVAPEPVRVPMPEDEAIAAQQQDLDDGAVPLAVEDGTPLVTEPEQESDNDSLDLDPQQEDDGLAEAEQDIEMPAEEQEGWGLQDWYDASAQREDQLEMKIMKMLARERLSIDPNDLYALETLSYYQYLSEDLDAAEDTYDRIIDLYPDMAAGYNNKALIYKRRRQYAEEEGLYRVALSLEPDDYTAMNNLAVNLGHQGRFDEALEYMALLESMDPNDPYADLHRAKILAEMGNDDEAFRLLEKALRGMADLDTLHHIEFRQDIRVDPSFARIRQTERFRAILWQYYGEDSPLQE